MLDAFQAENIRLLLSPELKELAGPAITQEIQQAIKSKLNVLCKLELVARQHVDVETPFEARNRQQELDRQAAIGTIKSSEIVRKFNQAFGAELVEDSVVKIDE